MAYSVNGEGVGWDTARRSGRMQRNMGEASERRAKSTRHWMLSELVLPSLWECFLNEDEMGVRTIDVYLLSLVDLSAVSRDDHANLLPLCCCREFPVIQQSWLPFRSYVLHLQYIRNERAPRDCNQQHASLTRLVALGRCNNGRPPHLPPLLLVLCK